MSDMPERTYLKMHAWALQIGTLTDTAYIRHDIVDAKDAEIERLKALCKESLHCMKDAKRRFAPNTTNSDADDHIEKLAAYLKEKENGN